MALHSLSAVNDDNTLIKSFTVARDGFSLNCSVACEATERTKLERVCRYMARPPIAEERLLSRRLFDKSPPHGLRIVSTMKGVGRCDM